MIKIKENKNGSYSIQYIVNNEIITSEEIKITTSMINKDGITYYMLYDNDMKPYKEVFHFINFYMEVTSPNSKEKYLYALKIFYTYLTIFDLDIYKLDDRNITNLIYFLKGISPNGNEISMELVKTRSHNTISGYLTVFRSLVNFLNIADSVLLRKKGKVNIQICGGREDNISVDKYKVQIKSYKNKFEVPKYISVEEFKRIIKIIRKEYGKMEECIVRLMYEGGLRIGEVLGLTADDITVEEYTNNYQGMIYIRNRFTDKPYQRAKTCMKIIDRHQYSSREYCEEGYGYQISPFDIEVVDLINEYIEETHVLERNKHKENYYKYTITDRVRKNQLFEDDNYYVFINSLGKPISIDSWNRVIRNIFLKANIYLDKVRKSKNLNHRFRHGFAMYLVEFEGCRELELKIRMRHTSINSTYIYFNPTQSDIIRDKEKISHNLYTKIPELRINAGR